MEDVNEVSELILKSIVVNPQHSKYSDQGFHSMCRLCESDPEITSFLSGSGAEFYINTALDLIGDLDIMYYRRNLLAVFAVGEHIELGSSNLSSYSDDCRLWRIDSTNCPPGFAHLHCAGELIYNWYAERYDFRGYSKEEGYNYLLQNDFVPIPWQKNCHSSYSGPAKVAPTLIRSDWTQLDSDRVFQETTCDDVRCIPCINWPSEAMQWFSRARKHGWPDEATIRSVWNGGCHVVPVAHPDYKFDRFQLRYSFSKAEVILLRTWTPNQQIVYHLLRYFVRHKLVKDFDPEKKIVCNYHLKTIMLYACERKSQRWWNSNCLIGLCSEPLTIFNGRFKNRQCPNFFMPDSNLFDFKVDEILFKDISEVIETFSNRKSLTEWFRMFYVTKIFTVPCSIEEFCDGKILFRGNNVDDIELHSRIHIIEI